MSDQPVEAAAVNPVIDEAVGPVTLKLKGIGLEQYATAITDDQGYDSIEVLQSMTAAELKELADEVSMKPGQRKKFMNAFAPASMLDEASAKRQEGGQQMQMQVQVPAGVVAGQAFQVSANSQVLTVTATANAGAMMTILAPAAPAVPPAMVCTPAVPPANGEMMIVLNKPTAQTRLGCTITSIGSASVVEALAPGGISAASGLMVSDIIKTVNGEAVGRDGVAKLKAAPAGDIRIVISRGGDRKGSVPPPTAPPPTAPQPQVMYIQGSPAPPTTVNVSNNNVNSNKYSCILCPCCDCCCGCMLSCVLDTCCDCCCGCCGIKHCIIGCCIAQR